MSSIDWIVSLPSHTLFIVGSYAVAAVLMAIEVLLVRARHRKARLHAAQPLDNEP